MLRFSTRFAFALALMLLVAGCSNPLAPAPSDPVGPAFSQNSSASNSGKKCENPAAAMGGMNMIKGVGMFDPAMERAARQGIDGMWRSIEVSGCW